MRRAPLLLALIGLLALAGQAGAVICTVDDVPAASLVTGPKATVRRRW